MTSQEGIHGAADQFRHSQTGFFGALAQRVKLLVGEVEVNPVHTPIIHTFSAVSTALTMLVSAAFAQEKAVPDTPVPATVTEYRIIRFEQERDPDWRFVITFKDNNGRLYTDEHRGLTSIPNPTGGEPLTNPDGADSFLKQLNTANFSTVSLTRRLLQHLVQHGKIPAATVTGTPESAQ